MAMRSFLGGFTRLRNKTKRNLQYSQFSIQGGSNSRFNSSSVAKGEINEESTSFEDNDDLKGRIFRLRHPKRSAATVIQKWIDEGKQVTTSELRQISRGLRKSRRYKHALEISEWMVQNEELEMSDTDRSMRIELISKVFGIDAAERYFESLSSTAKSCETFTSLLHAYASMKLTDRAECLFERIKDSGLAFNSITYNEMMTLYMSVGQVEKVAQVIEELKRKGVSPDIFTYNLWISSLAATFQMNEVARVLDEMRHNPCSIDSWVRYRSLVNIYIDACRLADVVSGLDVETEKGISQREWITYDFLIILYAGLGDKDKIDEIWRSLKMTKQPMTSRNYVCVLASYLSLGDLKEVGDVIEQWRQCRTPEFDLAVCRRIMGAFEDAGLAEKASAFQTLMIQKNCNLEEL